VVIDGTRDEVYSQDELLLSLGLDIPEVTKIMKKIKQSHPDMNDKIYTVDDAKEEIMRHIKKRS
jgi:energy-coupling factor transport system ATP-binding protein